MKGQIHSLVFLVFTALALPVSGCVVDHTNNGCFNPIDLTWSIDDNLGHGLFCSDVGASTVRLTAAGSVTDFSCSAYGGETLFDVPGGTYTIDAQLLTANGSLLSDANDVFSVPTCGGINVGLVQFCVGAACP